jgi:hypothetical protein
MDQGQVNQSHTFLALLSLSQHGKCRRPLEFSFSQRDATALRTEIFTAIIAGRAPAFVSCMAVSHVSAYLSCVSNAPCLYDWLSFILLALVLQQVAKHDGLTLLQEASEVASHHASAKMVSDKDLRNNFSMSSNCRGIICVLHCCQVKDSVTPCHKIQQDAFTMDAFTMDACCN